MALVAQTRGIAGSLLGADLSPEAKQAATDWELSKSKLPKVTPKLMPEQSSTWGPALEVYQKGHQTCRDSNRFCCWQHLQTEIPLKFGGQPWGLSSGSGRDCQEAMTLQHLLSGTDSRRLPCHQWLRLTPG